MNIEQKYRECKANGSYITIPITEDESQRVQKFLDEIAEQKMKESQYQLDHGKLKKRYKTGLYGEIATKKLLGYTIDDVDLSIGGTRKYAHADLKDIGFNAGIKTVEVGKAPVVFKDSYYGEVICVLDNDHEVTVCGYASPKVLKEYSSDEYILDPNLRAKGTKTGFYGFEKLTPIRNIMDLTLATDKRK